MLTLSLEEENLIIVAGTNRGLMEISKAKNETKTIKTWFLHTPISKVQQKGLTDFLCLDFVSQRLVEISTVFEMPSEIKEISHD